MSDLTPQEEESFAKAASELYEGKREESIWAKAFVEAETYSELDRKIIGSYVMESAIDEATSTEEWADEEARPEAFMKEVAGMEGQSHESVGEGTDAQRGVDPCFITAT